MANEIIVRHEFDTAQLDKLTQATEVLKQSLSGRAADTGKVVKDLKEQVNLQGKVNRDLQKQADATESVYAKARRLKKEFDAMAVSGKKLSPEATKLKIELEKTRREAQEFNRVGRTVQNTWGKALGSFQFKFNALGNIAANVASSIRRGFQQALKIILEFDKSTANLAAVLGKTKKEIEGLSKEAIRLGAITRYTATNVVELQTELAKLGFTTEEISASTRAILDFAAATNADLARAAQVAGIAVRAFGLSAIETERVVSTLAVATTKSALRFEDFETILSTAGPVARAYGFTLEDLIALQGKLRDAGFDASKAATATRNILLNLADTNGKLAKSIGGPVQTFDELIDGLITLRERGVSLNETLEMTDKRSVAAFNQFLNTAEGAKELREAITGVNEELADMVETQLDSLTGSLTLVKSAWEKFILSLERGETIIAKTINKILLGVADALNALSNADIVATTVIRGATKLTEDQIERWFDLLSTATTKNAKNFQVLIKAFDEVEFTDLFGKESEFKDLIRRLGFTTKEAGRLWDEYLKRRNEQKQKEIAINFAANRRMADQEKNNSEALADFKADQKEKELQELKKLDDAAFKDWLELEKAKIAIIQDRAQKEIAEEYVKHQTNLRNYKNNNVLTELEYIRHLQAMAEIRARNYEKPLEKKREEINTKELKTMRSLTDETAKDAAKKLKLLEEGEVDKGRILEESTHLAYSLGQAYLAFYDRSLQKELELYEGNEEEQEKIRRKYAKRHKVISIVQAVIDTASAVVKALKTEPFLPMGPIMAALAAATGAAQIGIIAAQKFAKGGWVEGPGHSRGGVPIEAEGGEFIIRKERARQFDSILESINSDPAHKVWNNLNIELNKKAMAVPSININNRKVEQLLQQLVDVTESTPKDMGKYFVWKHKGITYKIKK